MNKDSIVIREIKMEDNAQIEEIIKACFHEFKIPFEGTAYSDPETSSMYKFYQNDNDIYYIIECKGMVMGGAGIKPLTGFEKDVCELQKMYFSPIIRGKGMGKKMVMMCVEAAKEKGFKSCYLESASQLKAAIHLYESLGFKYLDGALGHTGHYSCGVWMIKDL